MKRKIKNDFAFRPSQRWLEKEREEETQQAKRWAEYICTFPPPSRWKSGTGAQETRISLRICYLAQVGRAGESSRPMPASSLVP